MNKLIIKTAMSIALIACFYNLKAQNSADFLKDYIKFSAFGQYTVEKEGVVFKEDPTVNYSINKYVVQHFGVSFNVYQTKHWNFKTGLIFKFKLIAESFLWTGEQTGAEFDYKFSSTFDSASKMNAIPLIAEYIIPISKRIKWEIAPSFTFAYFTGQEGGGGHILGFNPNPIEMYTYFDGYDKNPLFTSAEISTGFYFLFKHFMLQPEFRYSKSFRDVFTGHYTIENLRTEPHNSKGTFKQSGDYWGFSLSIYIKKKGKNKKK